MKVEKSETFGRSIKGRNTTCQGLLGGRNIKRAHGCSGERILLEHERYYGLGMDARVSVCAWNTNLIMVWAWMLG